MEMDGITLTPLSFTATQHLRFLAALENISTATEMRTEIARLHLDLHRDTKFATTLTNSSFTGLECALQAFPGFFAPGTGLLACAIASAARLHA